MATNRKNLANGVLASNINSTQTTITLGAGYGATMPETPFFLTITPVGLLSTVANSEIVEVTSRSTDTLTVVRGQKGTTAKTFAKGSVVANGVYAEDKIGSDNIDLTTLSKICIGGTYNDTPIAQDAQIVFDKTISTSGTGLTKVGNTVRVGAGVKQVSVSAGVFCFQNNPSQNYGWFGLYKNTTSQLQVITNIATSQFNTGAISNFILDVVEGDVISLKAIQGNWSVRGIGTFLTVMQVA